MGRTGSESLSWGRVRHAPQDTRALAWTSDPLPDVDRLVLPYGRGRSYGDNCLNLGELLLNTAALDHVRAVDWTTGSITCEAGVTLDHVLRLSVPRGWFLPVSPGTKFITVGGAVANDVHGKNHHVAGTFGHHVESFELLRSDGSRRVCTADQNADLFHATIGGLGLTGLITWVKFKMIPIASSSIDQATVKFGSLDEFFALSAERESKHHYSVAWIDCLARQQALGRGHLILGDFARAPGPLAVHRNDQVRFPFEPPVCPLNALSIKAFNAIYYNRQWAREKHARVHYDPFFYPLDRIRDWNRIYGRRGFHQYQCVVPFADGRDAIRDILRTIADARTGSFLAVLKVFGSIPSRGLLSFARPGVTLALDFPNRGSRTEELFRRLDAIVASTADGAIYPAKDLRMSPALFRRGYPRLTEFKAFVDPKFSSTQWRRLTS